MARVSHSKAARLIFIGVAPSVETMSLGCASTCGVSIAVLSAALLTAPPASAGPAENRAAAREQLNQARAAEKRGQRAESCQHLAEVERLDPKLPTLLELAECTEELGNIVEARALWVAARERAKHDEKPQSRARAESRIAAMQKRIAHLTLQLAAGTPAGAQVLRDESMLDAAQLGTAVDVNPGEHTITVKLAGHDDAKQAVKLADGESRTLAVAAGAPTAALPTAVPVPPASGAPVAVPVPVPVPSQDAAVSPAASGAAPHSTWWTGARTAGVIAGGVGVVAAAGGSVLCLASDSGSADTRIALGGAALAVGGVLLVSSVVLLASGSNDDTASHARLRLVPTLLVGSGTTLIGANGRF
jgi:hypothetical protein